MIVGVIPQLGLARLIFNYDLQMVGMQRDLSKRDEVCNEGTFTDRVVMVSVMKAG